MPKPYDCEIELRSREGGREQCERLPARHLGGKRYRLVGSPTLIGGVAYGDEVELDAKAPLGYRMLSRGGNVCVQVILPSGSPRTRDQITRLIEPLGGGLDAEITSSGSWVLVYNIPVTASFPAIEKAMEEIGRRFHIENWMYANVYDPMDGTTPLNWWENW